MEGDLTWGGKNIMQYTYYFLKILFIFRERERRGKEWERNINVWEIH